MSDKTGIQWTDATWNPIRGCSRVSEGCRNCYAEVVAARFSKPGQPYEGLARRTANGGARWTGKIMFVEKHLEDPLRWRKPKRIFVTISTRLAVPARLQLRPVGVPLATAIGLSSDPMIWQPVGR
jgi:protein gp37